ncbi:NACHT, LRR and PYD domains-containing protein 3 [Megalops cyprinoides]|uniref:NACHT, LRR and PYD domains-containing protein 3 n=1 Tax=Megalops cyprinoides TaxID=118141 RepID=UPI0018649591|nr:NACHT, LRR and PYD domains-containing protein 3 [Megalops cyprinoides]
MAQLMVDTLEELEEKDFKKFRLYLKDNVLEGYKPIPRGQLEGKDVPDVVDIMMKSYGKEPSFKITLEILKKIQRNDLVQRLVEDTEKISHAQTSQGSEVTDPSREIPRVSARKNHVKPPPLPKRTTSLHPSITAQTGGTAVLPQLDGCTIAGDFTVNVTIGSDNKANLCH